jgi:hypothetical protein
MEAAATTNTTTSAAPAQQAAATPAPAPVQTAPASSATTQNTTPPESSKMSSGGSIGDFFDDINWVDVGILMLGTAALYYTIYYYRIKIKTQKRELLDVANRIDMMDAKISALQKNAQESLKQPAKRQRRVVL